MAGGTTADYDGVFKRVYSNIGLVDLLSADSQLTRAIKFKGKSQMLGQTYNQPVVVRSEQGFTYARPNSGAFNINPAQSMKTQNAILDGFIILEACGVDYESVKRSDNGGDAAFADVVDIVMQDGLESFGRRLEIGLLYGQSATGLGSFVTGATGTATTAVLTFVAGQFAAGMWSPLEGAKLDAYTTANAWLNTTGDLTVSGIDIPNTTITVTGLAADITAIKAAATGAYLRFASGGTDGADEAVGLDRIMTNTGTLFGISAATYNYWKATTYTVGGALTFPKILAANALAAARGLSEEVDIYVSPSVWTNLSNEQIAYRQMDSSYSSKEAKNGFESLKFFSQTGTITVKAHKYVKSGDAFMFPTSRAVRIGASDVDFYNHGGNSPLFIENQTTAGFTFRLYSQQSLLVETPAKCVKLTGITVS